jgi:hypothetical protein
MIVCIGGSKRLVVGGFVGVNGQNRKLIQVVAGVGGNRLVWEIDRPVIPTEKVIYCGTFYCGQDHAF